MMKIFGVSISPYPRRDALAQALAFLHGESLRFLFTPNAEILLEARKNEAYRNVLNRANLSLPDSIGVVLAGKIMGERIPERIAGADFALDLITHAARHGERVALVGGGEGIAQKAAGKLAERHPGLSIHAEPSVGLLRVTSEGKAEEVSEEQEAIARIRRFAPQILLVGLGAPKQEFWITRIAPQLPSVRIAMGIGGAIDYWAGAVRRAPQFLRNIGFEWLWRLLREPRRARRIFAAVIVFPILVFTERAKRARGPLVE